MTPYHQLQQTNSHPVLSTSQLPILSSVVSVTLLSGNDMNSTVTRHATTNASSAKSMAVPQHYRTKRPNMAEECTIYFCHVEGCKYGFELDREFSRKDNRDRHLASHARKREL
ncbi:hypothetical protein N7478_001362 [Penicillium angulare]|uniref:uncharacterized protein n=1 Tax=Penicillium angulare TaxID=116970 RepID=UPI002541E734|nr:uncharacterized protein N7478_001362 [Penicillium angulare]KAJ5292111.1 hypothetical protein N7478_001362 [Penicillium angulare]